MPAMLWTKLASSLAPSGVCTTSGWNMMPYILRAGSPKIAKGAPSERPKTSKPSGNEITRSPWLIQTWWRWPVAHRPSNSGHSFSISTKARPNSRWSEPSASPPSWTHMVICP